MDFITKDKPSNDFYKKVTGSDVEQYLISLETREVNGKTIRTGDSIQATRWSALNTFFDFLINKKEYLTKNPMAKTDRPTINTEHKITYLTEEEIAKLLKAVDNNEDKLMSQRDKTIISLFLATGLRVGALININVEDIDFDNNVIHVIEKRQKVRDIPFGDRTNKLLKSWIDVRNEEFADVDSTALFLSQKKNRISVDAVSNMIKKYADDANIKKHITPHKMRSSVATNLVKKGTNIQTIANMLGHANIQTTLKYAAVLDEEKDRAVNSLDNLF
jgi:site-specific recombinase XerD